MHIFKQKIAVILIFIMAFNTCVVNADEEISSPSEEASVESEISSDENEIQDIDNDLALSGNGETFSDENSMTEDIIDDSIVSKTNSLDEINTSSNDNNSEETTEYNSEIGSLIDNNTEYTSEDNNKDNSDDVEENIPEQTIEDLSISNNLILDEDGIIDGIVGSAIDTIISGTSSFFTESILFITRMTGVSVFFSSSSIYCSPFPIWHSGSISHSIMSASFIVLSDAVSIYSPSLFLALLMPGVSRNMICPSSLV